MVHIKNPCGSGKKLNNVVVNKPVNPYKIRNCGFFFLLKNTPKYELELLWSHFDLDIWLYKQKFIMISWYNYV